MDRRTCTVLAAATLLVGAFGAGPASAGQSDDSRISPGLQLKPARTVVSVAPGEQGDVRLTLSNTTDDPIEYGLAAVDLQASDTESFARPAYGSATRSARRWLALPEAIATLAPGSSSVASVRVNAPSDARPGTYAVAVYARQSFSAVDALDPSAIGSNVRTQINLASTFVIDVLGDAQAAARIASTQSPRFVWGGREVAFEARVVNSGDTLLELEAITEVSSFGAFARRDLKTPTELPTLPDGERTLRMDWTDRPWIGWFQPRLVVAGGSGSDVRLERGLPTVFVLPPWWLLVLLALAIALPVRSSRRRRRRMDAYRAERLRRGVERDDEDRD